MQPFSVGPPPTGPTQPPDQPRSKWRWAWFGCLPVVVLAVVVLIVASLLVARGSNDADPPRPTTSGPTSVPPASTLPDSPTTAPVTTPPADGEVARSSCAMQQGLVRRQCFVFRPADVDETTRLPVVVLLHGLTETPSHIRGVGEWDRAVIDRRLIVVTPEGVSNSWNAGGCCAIAKVLGVDDVTYLSDLIDELVKRPDVDPKQIFMVGGSNGGMMTYRFACAHGDRLAGMASVAGSKVDSCALQTLPVIHVHGTDDRVVPYEGGESIATAILGVTVPAVPSSLAEIAAAQSCSQPVTADRTGWSSTSWSGCSGGANVELVTIPGGSHDWPTGEPVDATEQILTFFGL